MTPEQEAAINVVRNAYEMNFHEHKSGPKSLFWNDRATQYLRFEQILQRLRPFIGAGASIHDLGSGLCDFYDFLHTQGLASVIDYSGTELVEDMNVAARKRFPHLKLESRNFLDNVTAGEYDFCIASGTFNLHGGIAEPAWRALCMQLIETMFERSRRGIAFNMLSSYRTRSDASLCYFDPREMFDFLTTRLSRFVTVDTSSPLFEVTYTVMKQDFMSNHYEQPEFRKYFGNPSPSTR